MFRQEPGRGKDYTSVPLPACCDFVSIRKNLFFDIAAVLALLLVGMLGYRYSPQLLPKSDAAAQSDAGCDLHRQACGATLPGGGRIYLSIAPRPIPNLQPLDIEVRVADVEARKAAFDLAGATMSMGVNRVELAPAGPGRFIGTATLPVCVTGAMSWRATVLLETNSQRISAPFHFDSLSH